MAKQYELSELKRIHAAREANIGVIYQTEDRYFKGIENGRLEEITDLVLINANTTNISINTADIEGLEETLATKAEKCFALAMAIAL